MLKKFKNIFILSTLVIFIFLVSRYYFSENNIILTSKLRSSYLANDKNNDLKGWIKKYGFKKNKRVIQDIEVSKEWQFAVETVLGENLAGLRIDSIQRAIEASSKLSSGKITLINDISVNEEISIELNNGYINSVIKDIYEKKQK